MSAVVHARLTPAVAAALGVLAHKRGEAPATLAARILTAAVTAGGDISFIEKSEDNSAKIEARLSEIAEKFEAEFAEVRKRIDENSAAITKTLGFAKSAHAHSQALAQGLAENGVAIKLPEIVRVKAPAGAAS